jgi:molybdopterin synthase catalytic subunit
MSDNILINGPVSREIILEFLESSGRDTDTGGHSVFLGRVRADIVNGKRVKAIEYSAYESMVRVEADKIKLLILAEFNDVKTVEILHSTGVVNAGEASLFVLVSAGHRQQANEACSMTVELIKEKLPVWKKEIFEDNTSEWRQNDIH